MLRSSSEVTNNTSQQFSTLCDNVNVIGILYEFRCAENKSDKQDNEIHTNVVFYRAYLPLQMALVLLLPTPLNTITL